MKRFTLIAAIAAATLAGAASAEAMTLPQPAPAESGIIQVSGGCGLYGHRNPYGACVPNYARPVYRACPPGTHLGPYRGRCWPN